MHLRDPRPPLRRATAALTLCTLAVLAASPVLAQPSDSRGPSHNASDRARLATSASGLMTPEGGAFGRDRAPGLALAPGQQRALDRALELSQGPRESAQGGRGNQDRGNQIVRLPRKLAVSESFTFGYSSARGLVPEERPNGGGRLLAVRDEHVDIDGESYGWVGRIFIADDPAEPVGSVSLIYHRGGDVTGTIQVRTDLYRIEPLGNRLHVLIDVDESTLPEGGGGIKNDGGGTRAENSASGDPLPKGEPAATPVLGVSGAGNRAPSGQLNVSTDDPAAVTRLDVTSSSTTSQRVMVLYTTGAKNSVGNISSVVNESILISNQSYGNSSTSPRLRLVHSQELAGFVETRIGLDINRLETDFTVKSLRDQYKADIVVLLTKPDHYVEGIYLFQGVASEIFTPGNDYSENAYAIVDVKYSVLTKVFPHEVGHVQGGRHHPEDDEANCGADGSLCSEGYDYGRGHREIWSDCPYGIGWICGYNRFATIMAYEVGSYQRVNYFSNPDVEYQGRHVGRSARDNARAFDASAVAVAGYRPDPLAVSISGPSLLTPGQTGTWYANVTGGPAGAPTYRWFKDGAFTGVTTRAYTTQAGSSGSNGSFPPVDSDFGLRVDVVRGSESASRSLYVTVYDNGGCDPTILLCPVPDPGLNPNPGFLTAAPEEFALQPVRPNPVTEGGTIAFDVPNASAVAVTVYDVLGREVSRPVDGELGAGTHRVPFDVSTFSPGVYVLVMRAGDFTSSQQITVVR